MFFGNEIIAFNNLISYCEILGIRNIYLSSKINWLIKNDINTDKIHISIISPNKINCNSDDTFCTSIGTFFYPIIMKPERRSIILKDEIKRNLPQIKINKEDLYIYIRSGDSFDAEEMLIILLYHIVFIKKYFLILNLMIFILYHQMKKVLLLKNY